MAMSDEELDALYTPKKADYDQARQELDPNYQTWHAEYERLQRLEKVAKRKKETTKNPLARVYWHFKSLHGEGQGAETKRCLERLRDEFNQTMDAKVQARAYQLAIRRGNRARGFDF